MKQQVGQIGPWRRRDNMSVDKHQELVTAINQSRSFFSEGMEIRNGPNGRSTSVLRLPLAKLIEVQVGDNKIAAPNGDMITLASGWFAGRMQIETGKAFDPSIAYDDDDYFDDFATKDDCYLFARVESGVAVNEGDVIVGRYLRDSIANTNPDDMSSKPSLPVIEVIASAGGGAELVQLENPSGSAGDASTVCSFSYDVYEYGTGILIASGVPWISRPKWQQKMVAGDYGTYQASIGFLIDANEYPDTGPC